MGLDDQDGLASIGSQRCFECLVEGRHAITLLPGLVGFPGQHLQPLRGFAHLHPPDAAQARGFEVQVELPAAAEVALDLAVPAG